MRVKPFNDWNPDLYAWTGHEPPRSGTCLVASVYAGTASRLDLAPQCTLLKSRFRRAVSGLTAKAVSNARTASKGRSNRISVWPRWVWACQSVGKGHSLHRIEQGRRDIAGCQILLCLSDEYLYTVPGALQVCHAIILPCRFIPTPNKLRRRVGKILVIIK